MADDKQADAAAEAKTKVDAGVKAAAEDAANREKAAKAKAEAAARIVADPEYAGPMTADQALARIAKHGHYGKPAEGGETKPVKQVATK